MAQTRWLFTLLVLVSVLLLLPGLFASPGLLNFLIAVGAYTGLLAIWSYRYQSGRAPVLLGVLEAALVLATTVAGPDPTSILPYIFASLWLRALYGTTRGALLHTGFLAVAVVVALWVWTMLPGRPDMAPAASIAGILNTVPVMFLTVGVARYLARSLFAREQSQQRDAALLQLSKRLIGVTERKRFACWPTSVPPRSVPRLPGCSSWWSCWPTTGRWSCTRPARGPRFRARCRCRSCLRTPAAAYSRCRTAVRWRRPPVSVAPGWVCHSAAVSAAGFCSAPRGGSPPKRW